MAVNPKGKMIYVSDKADELVLVYPEAAVQTFVSGDPVTLAAGKVTVMGTPTNLVGNAIIFGIADTNATGVTDSPIRVRIPRLGDIYLMNYESDDTPVVTDFLNTVAGGFDLKRGATATGTLFVDQDTTTFVKVHVLGLADPDAILGTTVGAPVLVRVRGAMSTALPLWFGAI